MSGVGSGFWAKLKRPIFALAPMANVTDAAFRQVIAKYGKPAVMWTEFVSCDGLCSKGRERLLEDFWFTPAERPIVAQIFGSNPDNFTKCAQLIKQLGFDGIDINMGCPDRNVEKQGGGAALIKNPKLAQEVIKATQAGAGDLPVSVKTRLGYNTDILEDWLPQLLAAAPAAITIHVRTRKEMSKVPARWERVTRAVEIRDTLESKTLILGNGDIDSLALARQRVAQTGADGVMIGRGIFGDPWFFNEQKGAVSVREKLEVMLEHTKLYEKIYKQSRNFATMKKHYKAYVNGFDGAKELRIKLMAAEDFGGVNEVTKKCLIQH